MYPKQSISFPEVAIIRKGTPKRKINKQGREVTIQGNDLNNKFRVVFNPGADDARKRFQELHPESYTKYGPEYTEPDGFLIIKMRAMIPFPNVRMAWEWANEAHQAGRMVAKADDEHYITLRDPNTGAYIVENGEPFTPYKHGDTVKYERAGQQYTLPIRTVGRLRLFLPELERLVFVTLKTTSFYDRVQMDAQLQAIQFFADTLNRGNASGIPLYIYRAEKEVTWNKPDGGAQRVKKWLINIEADPEWVKAAVNRMSQFALTGEVVSKALLPEPAQPQTISGVDDPSAGDEPDDYFDAEYKDSDPEPQPQPAPKPIQPQAQSAQSNGERPYSAETLKAKIEALAEKYANYATSEAQRNLVAMSLAGCFAGQNDPEEKRHVLQEYLTGSRSLKNVSNGHIQAILKWLELYKDADGAYIPSQNAIIEAHAAYTAGLVAGGQQTLI